MNKRREMDKEEADIKKYYCESILHRIRGKMPKKPGRFGLRDSRPTVLILLEIENLSCAMILTFINGRQPLTHGKMTSRAYR